MAIVAASILSADFANLESDIKAADNAGADWIHLDIMDGCFVPNITFGIPVVKSIRKCTKKIFDAHLMITNPAKYVSDFARAGANIITIHAETDPHMNRTIAAIKELGVKAGVAINPATPLCLLEDILPCVDVVTIMSVNPGFPAQKLIELSYDKTARLQQISKKFQYNFLIEIDGGVNDKTAPRLVQSGATVLVAGSFIFCSNNYAERISFLKSL